MRNGRLLTGLIAGVLALALAPSSVGLAAGNPGTVVATGLNGPRGLSMGSDGNLYVAEAGTGGDLSITVGDQTLKAGLTGRITRIAPDGTKTVVVDGLPSAITEEGEASGPQGVIYADGSLWITGLYMASPTATEPSNGLFKADPATGKITPVVDLNAYEVANNPDGFGIEADPYGLALGTDGLIYIADAAANVLYSVNPADASVKVVAVFDGIPLPNIPETTNPDRKGAHEADPVPTGVSIAEDGHIFVGLLTGFPFLDGTAKVMHVTQAGKVTDAVTGLTMVTDVELGSDDSIYASEFGSFSLTSTPPGFAENSGKVVRNMDNGTTLVLADGLNQANGITLNADESEVYVVVNSDSPAGTGQVLSFGTGGGTPVTIGMPVTGTASFPLAAMLAALLLVVAGAAMRVFQARRAS